MPKKKEKKKSELCPMCRVRNLHPKEVMNALSRHDNKTYVCSQCGALQGILDFSIKSDKGIDQGMRNLLLGMLGTSFDKADILTAMWYLVKRREAGTL